MRRVDVAIVGGGLAGNLLARQLRRTVPDASVLMVEKTGEPRWKVGESTVEIASNYMVRKQGLSTYLYDNHLPKMGLRFFFDTAEKNAELTTMSEVGTDRPPPLPSFQLDRARIEADLRVMNTADGVDVRIGWQAKNVELGSDGAKHRLQIRSDDGETEEVEARWLVDGAGRASIVSRQKDLRREVDHPLSAVWGRFEGVDDFDVIQNDPWRRRTKHVARTLSTVHFCYDGYWIWFIPLGRGVTSVGVVGQKDVFKRGMRTEEGFLSFINEHRAASSLLTKAKLLDIDGYTQLAYATERFFDQDRWVLIGDAAAFTDPFYSPGSDFISLECDFVTEMVRRDLAGDTFAQVADLARTYDAYMQYRFQNTMLLYQGLYPCFGSYELMRIKLNFDLGCYYNIWLDPFALDKHLNPKFLIGELRVAQDSLVALRYFGELFRTVYADMRKNGTYHRKNLGEYNRGVDCLREWMDEVGEPRKKRLIKQRTESVFHYGRTEALKLLGQETVQDSQPWLLHQFSAEQLEALTKLRPEAGRSAGFREGHDEAR